MHPIQKILEGYGWDCFSRGRDNNLAVRISSLENVAAITQVLVESTYLAAARGDMETAETISNYARPIPTLNDYVYFEAVTYTKTEKK